MRITTSKRTGSSLNFLLAVALLYVAPFVFCLLTWKAGVFKLVTLFVLESPHGEQVSIRQRREARS